MARSEGRVDLYRVYPQEYVQRFEPIEVSVGREKYLEVRGRRAPGAPGFRAAIRALYGTAYALKMRSKAEERDFRVMGLEGRWWTGGSPLSFGRDRRRGRWVLGIRVPAFIESRDLSRARTALRARGQYDRSTPVHLVLEHEGRAVQALHIGPYSREGSTLHRLARYAADHGLALAPVHHELYFSDPRRGPARRLRTLLRVPVRTRNQRRAAARASPGPA